MKTPADLKSWLHHLPADVYARIMNNLFESIADSPNHLLSWVTGEEEIPLLAKCCIERASREENHPFSFDDIRVNIMTIAIEMAIDIVKTEDPELSADEITDTIFPVISYLEANLLMKAV